MAEERIRSGDSSCRTISEVGGAILVVGSILTFLLQQTFVLPGPRCSVLELYVPALDLSAAALPANISNSTNPFIFFVLGLENSLGIRSISYGQIGLTFYYGHKSVGNYVVPGFYQGSKKTAHRRDVVETRGVPWGDALAAVSAGSTAGFRVELAARPRFKILFWYSKEKKIRVSAEVAVGGAGVKVEDNDIRLSSADSRRGIRVLAVVLSLFVAIYLLF